MIHSNALLRINMLQVNLSLILKQGMKQKSKQGGAIPMKHGQPSPQEFFEVFGDRHFWVPYTQGLVQ
jgi:hypothetical protein